MSDIVWIAVDWGTTNLRVWGMRADGRVNAEASSDKGMAKLDCAGFELALLDLIDGWLRSSKQTLVIACGMVGARQGWIEVPYRQAPCRPVFSDLLGRPETRDPRLKVIVLPGIKQIEPADVMRGEETQIAGVLLQQPQFDGVLCLPGTHTKWVWISGGEIIRFKTYMTGEIFSLLSQQSVLRHSLGGELNAYWDTGEFKNAVAAVFAEPMSLAGRLFSIRAETLVSDLGPAKAVARLSGVLIGAELAASRTDWQHDAMIVVGNTTQSALYADALRSLGQTLDTIETKDMTLAGLTAAYYQISGEFR